MLGMDCGDRLSGWGKLRVRGTQVWARERTFEWLMASVEPSIRYDAQGPCGWHMNRATEMGRLRMVRLLV